MTATIKFFQEPWIINAPDLCVRRNGTHKFARQLQAFIFRQLEGGFENLLTADVHGDTFADREDESSNAHRSIARMLHKSKSKHFPNRLSGRAGKPTGQGA